MIGRRSFLKGLGLGVIVGAFCPLEAAPRLFAVAKSEAVVPTHEDIVALDALLTTAENARQLALLPTPWGPGMMQLTAFDKRLLARFRGNTILSNVRIVNEVERQFGAARAIGHTIRIPATLRVTA